MKKILSPLSILIFLFSTFSFAQIVYESSDFTTIGESFPIINTMESTAYDFEQTGADHFWDYNLLPTAETEAYGYEDPNNSPFKNVWCLYHLYILNCNSMFDDNFNMGLNLNQTLELGDYTLTNIYQHLLKDNSALQLKMYGANIDLGGNTLPAILEFDDPDDLFHFPMNFGDSYTDASSINMDFTDLGYDLVVESTGTRTNDVEGWGSLKIRNHTYENVLKLKSASTQFFNIYFEGDHQEIESTVVTYFWLDKDYGIPVLMVNGTEIDGQFIPTAITYLKLDTMAFEEFSLNQKLLYPNPTDGKIFVQLENNENILSVQILDQTGKILGTKLDATHLPRGVYLLHLKTNKRLISEKIIRK